MRSESSTKRRSLKALTLTLGAVLATPSLFNNAAEALTSGMTSNTVGTYMQLLGCTGFAAPTTTGTSNPATRDLTPGVATPASWAGTYTTSDTSVPARTVTQAYSMSATALTTKNGALPKSIGISFKASYDMTAPSNVSCSGNVVLNAANNFKFTTAQPLLLTVAATRSGAAYAEGYLTSSTDPAVYVDVVGKNLNNSSTTTVLLPPGSYEGDVEIDLVGGNQPNAHYRASGSATMSFAVPGAKTVGPTGTARPFVTLGASRTCANATLKTTITTNAARERQISKVVYANNGHVVRTVLGRAIKPGTVINLLHLPSSSAAKVKTTVTLTNGRKLTTSASYQPCSP